MELWVILGMLLVMMSLLMSLLVGLRVSYRASMTRQLVDQGPQTREELASALGMTLASSGSPSVLIFDGEVAGARAQLRVNVTSSGEENASSWKVSSFTLEVFVASADAFRLHVKSRDLWLGDRPAPLPLYSLLELPPGYDVEGPVEGARASLSRDLRDALADLTTRRRGTPSGDPIERSGWLSVRLGEFARFEGLSAEPHWGRVCHLVRDWPDLLARAEAVARALPGPRDLPALLLERVAASDESIEQRWRAAAALLRDHPESEAAARMRAEVDGLPEWVGALCALMEFVEGTTYASLSHALVVESESLRLELGERLGRRFPWETFIDPSCAVSIREGLFEAAMEAAPEDRDLALAGLLTGPLDAGENRARLYRRLLDVGWSPSPEVRARLARDAISSIRLELVRELHEREVTAEDGPTLAALTQSGHEGDVAPFIARLTDQGSFGSGSLSLAEGDEARGRISPAGSTGDLTPADDD